MIKVELERVNDAFAFEAKDAANHIIRFDAASEIGGNNSGVRPMQTLLMSLASCSAIDIVSILQKQRQTIDSFKIAVEGEREQGKEPALWKYAKILFQLSGTVDAEKARKACALSIDKYCSVAATLRAAGCTIEWNVEVK